MMFRNAMSQTRVKTSCSTRSIACLSKAMSYGPPSSWYDPPEPRHSNGSIIGPECNCDECHDEHDLVENYGSPDYQCCTDAVNDKVDGGEWCAAKPLDHRDEYLEDGQCLKCVEEKVMKAA
jgi:hypothetical protein